QEEERHYPALISLLFGR
ncbi:hypothetical protein, partial [Pantoea anthophila]